MHIVPLKTSAKIHLLFSHSKSFIIFYKIDSLQKVNKSSNSTKLSITICRPQLINKFTRMKVLLLMIGKTNQENLQQLIQDYMSRIQHYMNFESIIIPELKNIKNLSIAEQKEKEADLILKQIEIQDDIILLDENGKQYSSTAFSGYLEKKMSSSIKRTVFVIGGPFGFSKRIYDRANGMISMSPMTFSHQMIRLIFVEQLYRAMTIIRGENYHHE